MGSLSPGPAMSWSAARPCSPAATCPAIDLDRPDRRPRRPPLGPWTIWLEVQTAAPLPRCRPHLPRPPTPRPPGSARPGRRPVPADALGRLPGADEPNAPVTVDLNGRVAVRARGPDAGPATELVLSRSGYAGPPVRLQTNREFLARAIRLGFAEVEVVDADTPLVCRDRRPGPGLAAALEATRRSGRPTTPPGSSPPPDPAAARPRLVTSRRGSRTHRASPRRPDRAAARPNGHAGRRPGARRRPAWSR